MEVWWLGLHAFTVKGTGSISGEGTKIPEAMWLSQEKKKPRISMNQSLF